MAAVETYRNRLQDGDAQAAAGLDELLDSKSVTCTHLVLASDMLVPDITLCCYVFSIRPLVLHKLLQSWPAILGSAHSFC